MSSAKKSSHYFHFTHDKAGVNLNEVSRSKVNEVIYEMSKDSP